MKPGKHRTSNIEHRTSNRERPGRVLDVSIVILLVALFVLPHSLNAQEEPAKKTFFLPKNATAAAYVLGRLSNQELIEAPRSEFVYVALLQRKGLERKHRIEALEGLAKLRNTSVLAELIAGVRDLDKKGEDSESVIRDLSALLLQTKADELKAKRAELEKLATESQLLITRQIGFAAIVTGDGNSDTAWKAAEANPTQLADLVRGVEFVRAPTLRGEFYSKVEPLLHKTDAPELRRAAIAVVSIIPGHDVETFKSLAALVQADTETGVAVHSLARIPKNSWPKESVKPLLDAIIADLKKAPTESRSEPDFLATIHFAKDLASFFPTEESAAINKTLRGLGSSVFILRAVPEQMIYDQNLLVVEAGKPVEIILQNDDTMPHNLVLTRPGMAEEIGNAAEKMQPTPDSKGRLYVPNLPSVMQATVMVEPGQRAKLAFNAPRQEGDYPYLCSYPGHWRRMLGTLAVVSDVESYLATRAATAPKLTEWKASDFAAEFAQTNSARSLARGKDLFVKATCASCHKLGGEGVPYGPDLDDLLKRYHNNRAEVLQQILEPSQVISNRYRNIRFALKNGEDVTGMVMKEDADAFTVQVGPSEALVQSVPKKDVTEQQPRDLSPMPLGLLSHLSKEEILDLLAWIESGGKLEAHNHKH